MLVRGDLVAQVVDALSTACRNREVRYIRAACRRVSDNPTTNSTRSKKNRLSYHQKERGARHWLSFVIRTAVM